MKPLEPGDPQTLGQYRLLRTLGAGGMGKVFLGRSAQGRTVAVKLIHPQLALDPDFRSRFQREIAAARRVGGEWTAPVLDFDTEGEIPWVATGYIAGPALHDIVTQFGVLPERTLWRLAEGLALALTAIHDSGLVHRDLKPSNVLATVDGPRVIDFGIARAVGGSVLTRTGTVIGSPGYMSPEQVRGDTLGPASDVFSLGATLTHAATGAGPYDTEDGAAHALMYRVINEPPNLGQLAGPLRELVTACLAKNPGERPTPHEIAAAAAAHRTSGPWLPANLIDQLLRDTVQLLSIEEPARAPAADTPPPAPSTPPPTPTPTPTAPDAPPAATADDTMQLRVVAPPARRRRLPYAVVAAIAAVAVVATVLALTLGLPGAGDGRDTKADADASDSQGSAENGAGDDSPGQSDDGSDQDASKDPSDTPSDDPTDESTDDGSSDDDTSDDDQADTSGESSADASSGGGSSDGGSSDDSSGGSSDGGSSGGSSSGGSSGGSSDGSSSGSEGGSGGGGDEPPPDDGLNGQVSREMVGTWESSSDYITYDGSRFTGDVLGCFYTFQLESVGDGGRSVHLFGTSGCAGDIDVNLWLEGADTAGMNAFDGTGSSMSATMYRA
ncbi:serine/threonine-protein kinase [Streptomyces millisiae]|uniref:Protein kinase n=1 Tax=Streptomyces millisiae TaxID=3075542 RepID=A0ABU2LQU3_9ACTN|nr:protein kinase [Streptomyces sp. DSM 44918]MDT0319965.1 protein kinase [Streptomyces sp. DSM 44918]